MSKSPPWGLAWRSNTLFIVSTVGIGLFTDLFLYGLVVPILPFILSDRVHLPHEQIQSNVSGLLAAYAAASVVFSPPAGIIADWLSTRRLPFLVGLVALLLATLLLLIGKTVAILALARVLQGISGAVVWTVGMAMILDTVGPGHLGKTIGSVGALRIVMRRYLRTLTSTDLRLHLHRRIGGTSTWWYFIQKGGICWRIWAGFRPSRSRFHYASSSDRKEDGSQTWIHRRCCWG